MGHHLIVAGWHTSMAIVIILIRSARNILSAIKRRFNKQILNSGLYHQTIVEGFYQPTVEKFYGFTVHC